MSESAGSIITCKMDYCVFTLLSVFAVTPALSFPSGAPASACDTFTPSHGFDAQTTDVPYEIDISVFGIPVEVDVTEYGYVPGVQYDSKY